jgi:hypothetical protein
VDAHLDTFVTAPYVTIDDAIRMRPEPRQRRPEVGLAPKISDAELLALAVLQALLGFTSETRFLRHATAQLRAWFPYIAHQSGYNKRLRKGPGPAQGAHLPARPRHRALGRRHLGHGLDAGRVRTFAPDRPAQRPGRVGLLRLLRQPLALVLGPAPPPRVHPGRPAHHLRAGQPQDRRARGGPGPLRGRAHPLASGPAGPRG